ncbi:O-antigen ligase family protein [Lactobacillus sp. PV012]|uniref:O-antigen ligase family protein n=1 Tax=Lactobacillus sp. PV012 TaxID=2594494 RepID=UPI0022407100|nr:O-antigen ligase family protein [Lactobacillus sp. PV012]QNQ82786.1 hypothetical protein FP433_06940 [Lactobacillus sp. PV012]
MQKKIQKFLFWFILIQPFLDFYWLNTPPLSEILPFSFPTIIRIIGIIFLAGMYLSKKQSWRLLKRQWWIIGYLIILTLYCICHLVHVAQFKSLSATSYHYSLTAEIFYLVRMFLPLIVLYITKYLKFSEQTIEHLVQILVGTFSGIIVITNLLVISLRSYGDGRIGANFFAWFTPHYLSYTLTASKGFFYFANTLSAILFMLAALMIYFFIKNFNWINGILVFLLGWSMLMLGTKTSTLGFIIVLAAWFILYFIHAFIFKNIHFSWKIITCLIALGGIYLAIIPASPMIARQKADAMMLEREKGTKYSEPVLNKKLATGLKKTKTKSEREQYLKSFIKENYRHYSLDEKFVKKSYSYKNDPEFWYSLMTGTSTLTRLNNRFTEQAMLNQVVKYNNNSGDRWLGISYARTSNIFNLERDFIYQSYSLGWIGAILFLGIYIISEIYALIAWVNNKNNHKLLNSALLLANGICLVAAFYSGNVMDFLTATILLGFFTGYMLSLITKKESAD